MRLHLTDIRLFKNVIQTPWVSAFGAGALRHWVTGLVTSGHVGPTLILYTIVHDGLRVSRCQNSQNVFLLDTEDLVAIRQWTHSYSVGG